LKDVDVFKTSVKDTFGNLKRKHRGIVDELRTTEYETFSKIGKMNEPVSEHAGMNIDKEVKKLKQQITKVSEARNFLASDYID